MRLSVRNKLISGFTIVLMATGIVGWRGIVGMSDINEELNEIKAGQFMPAKMIANANIALNSLNRAVLNHVLSENIEKMEVYERNILEQKAFLFESLQQLSKSEHLSKRGKELLRKIESLFQQMEPILDHMVTLSRAGRQEEAQQFGRTELRPVIDRIDTIMTEFLQLQERQLDEAMNVTDARYEKGFRRISWIFVAALFLSFLIVLFLLNTILKSVNEMTRGAKLVGAGDFNQARVIIKSKDEFEYLGVVFNQMVDNLTRNINELESAEAEIRARNAQLVESNNALDEFAYTVSHDLREPLRGISNFSSFLVEDYGENLGDKGRSMLDTLVQMSKRMEDLIESILYYSRVGRVELAFKETDLNAVVKEVIGSMKASLEESGAEIRIPQKLPIIYCDSVRVGEIFYNLISNAMKFNDKPEKWIEIGFKPHQDSHVFYVRDNGIGIREKDWEKIFTIFRRLHGRDKFGGGTGTGMTIVKKIIERHDGKIWVESRYGEETTFYFTLQGGQQ